MFGRIAVGQGVTKRVYAGDDGGNDVGASIRPPPPPSAARPSGASTPPNAIKSSPYYDTGTDTVQYGTQGGTIIVLGGTGAVLNSGATRTRPREARATRSPSAPLYYNGVLAVGSTGGKLYFLDRNTGNATTPVTIIREYQFGSSEAVSGIGFDPTANRYMVSTASSSGDGRLYYVDLITDPTPTSL